MQNDSKNIEAKIKYSRTSTDGIAMDYFNIFFEDGDRSYSIIPTGKPTTLIADRIKQKYIELGRDESTARALADSMVGEVFEAVFFLFEKRKKALIEIK